MNKEILKEIALQAGGSHYPEVGGETLERFSNLLVERVIEAIENTPKTHAYTTYDLNLIEATIEKTIKQVREKFETPLIRKLPHENRSM